METGKFSPTFSTKEGFLRMYLRITSFLYMVTLQVATKERIDGLCLTWKIERRQQCAIWIMSSLFLDFFILEWHTPMHIGMHTLCHEQVKFLKCQLVEVFSEIEQAIPTNLALWNMSNTCGQRKQIYMDHSQASNRCMMLYIM